MKTENLKKHIVDSEDIYYTPEIEEFHIGFEYELFGDFTGEHLIYKLNRKWNYQEFDFEFGLPNDILIIYNEGKQNSLLRVKCLNSADIKNLGFKKTYTNTYETEYCQIEIFDALYLELDFNIKIYRKELQGVEKVEDTEEMLEDVSLELLFQGNVKNKSELKRILKQTGVNYGE